MAISKWLSTIAILLPFVTSACFQSPPSSEALRKPDFTPVVLSTDKDNDIWQGPAEPAASKKFTTYARRHAARYGLDWKLVVAVMDRESSFRHNAVSHKGAYGLMQIMPVTRAEIETKLGLEETASPSNNVRAGAFYLTRLSRNFHEATEENKLKLTLAAYNAGLTRIRDAQAIAAYLGEDANSWESVRASLQLLSSRFESLHRRIWMEGRPRGGYFRNPSETISYVDKVLDSYEHYSLTMR